MQIMAMTTMKDHERLDLLKEIGGTKVYEERREESLKVMKETEGRRKRIEEVVSLFQLLHEASICPFLHAQLTQLDHHSFCMPA